MEIADILLVTHERASVIAREPVSRDRSAARAKSRLWDRREVAAWARLAA
jgi:hypothetical protein